jgi:hypothetical protein
MEEFNLGTTVPHEEECIQLGQPNYSAFSKIEANTLMKQIIRELGNPPSGCRMKLVGCEHDFGVYYDIALVYDEDDEEHVEWFLKVEGKLPMNWDYESKESLKSEGYHL